MEIMQVGKEKEKENGEKIMGGIDIRKLDEQLQRHLDRVITMEKSSSDCNQLEPKTRVSWEIDPEKLFLKNSIARGTFASVHRGVYEGTDVAVKLFDLGGDSNKHRSRNRLFMQEVSVWHKLDHPNIAKLIGARMGMSEVNTTPESGNIKMSRYVCCIVVEYLPEGTLKSYLHKNRLRKLPFNVVIKLALDIARGLSYMHSLKIVHRDIKTDNMLLDWPNKVKITDFGISRIEAANLDEMTGQTGTFGYMAPEVFTGSPYDRKCDVYSFGICLWEIYCCSVPYQKYNFNLFKHMSAVVYQNLRPEIPECCPDSLARLMKKCWDRDPSQRPEMEEVLHMLEAIDTSKGGGMTPRNKPKGCFCFLKPRGS